MRGRGDEAASAPAPSPVATAPAPAASAPVASASPVASSSDVSIPYDAAARLAFDEWRAAHKKGDYVEAKFQKFKISYDAVTSANMAAKKQARDTGTSPVLKSLLASADE